MIPILAKKSSATTHVTLIIPYATTYFFDIMLSNRLTCYVTFHIFSDILINKHRLLFVSLTYNMIRCKNNTYETKQN